ncbi:MAG: polysaccharide biosynthesis tyrosine autokinase [Vicinamibacterales bacterium]|nr:polysaccharide biosynthesis tyrosine autokinase [Vicinamibacterales bacterium]
MSHTPADSTPAAATSSGSQFQGLGLPREPHLLDKLTVIHKHRRPVIIVFLAVLGWFMLDSYTTIPQYRASARLMIEEESSGVSAAAAGDLAQAIFYQDPEIYFQTQYRVLRGRELARRVAGALDLSRVPEFNGQGAKPTPLAEGISTVKSALRAPLRWVAPADPGAPIEPPAVNESAIERAYVDGLLSRIGVEPVRGSRLVDISFQAADPEFAARAINTLAEQYVTQNLEFKVQEIQKSLEYLAQERRRQQAVVQASERALAEYREQQNALSLDSSQNIVVSRLNSLNDSAVRARTERMQRETLWRQVQQAGNDRDSLSSIVQNTFIQTLKGRLTDLERDRTRLSERYGERHPEMEAIRVSIANAERQLANEIDRAVQTIRSEYEAAATQERELARALEEQKTAAMDLNSKRIDYTVIEREAETNRELYNSLLQREKELQVIANSRANNVRIIDRAEVPSGPFTPNHRRDWLLALLFATVFGCAIAFGLDYLDDTVKTPDDIARRLKLRFLGLVPSVSGDRHPLLSGPVPHDFGEAFRALRTALVSQATADGPKVISVTSAQPLEGKTTTAVNLAMALAVGGSRVLLVDADMRRPSVHKALRIANDRGLSQLLAGQVRMREVVNRTHDPNLLVITAGRTPSNPSELLSADRMRALVHGLESGPFDWVIIDTPPVLAVTDAVIVAPLVAGVVFVVGSEMTRWQLAERAVQTLLSGNPRSVVAVLNKVDFARNRYYYSRYYGHQYKSYYAEAPAA